VPLGGRHGPAAYNGGGMWSFLTNLFIDGLFWHFIGVGGLSCQKFGHGRDDWGFVIFFEHDWGFAGDEAED
jgi:hypothetical protein